MNKVRVTFAPSFKEVAIEEGKTILEAARVAGVYIDSQCNGKGRCGKCRIRVAQGGVTPLVDHEAQFVSPSDREAGYRLACMARVLGDVTVFVADENLLTSSAANKVFSKRTKKLNPAVKSYVIDLTREGNGGHILFQDVVRHLALKHGLHDLTTEVDWPGEIAKDTRKITIFVWMDKEVIAVERGEDERALGVALDVGTTTLALYLCDLKSGNIIASGSVTNPQVLFGTDIMSRIAYSVDHPVTGLKRMREELIRSINVVIERMLRASGFKPHQILDATVVGNTVMHHIFLGIAPDKLGLWPFEPSVTSSVDVRARHLGLAMNPYAYVHVLPVEAGFVGADNVGVLLSEEPYNHDEISLIIDLGTNGELVLGNRERLMSCSCATGPAFEGAEISSGMRATAGAIEKIRLNPATNGIDYAVIGRRGWASEHTRGKLKPVGMCGSAILDGVALLSKTGIIGKNGAFTNAAGIEGLRTGPTGIKEFLFVPGSQTGTGRDIVLTQKDIRQIQLAKAALHGGCKVLMRHFKLDSIERIVIAGAFGLHIDKKNALIIGLFPDCPVENILVVGNAAGHGAYLALVDRDKRQEADWIARRVEHIELALEKEFQREFIKALSFPG
ncbi:MAG TPA: ASKHA domain-containing protein [Syntrophorhabdaceae bacterium]|nr:ASKHA domain-containing protein [Syntrophorhabdaceae bacterium]